MKLKKKVLTLSTCFLIRELDPFFYELVIDSIKTKIAKLNFRLKPKKFLNLKISNKTLALFTLYLNIFSTIKLNTQKNKKKVNLKNIRTNLSYVQTNYTLLNNTKDKELNYQLYKYLFFDLYLKRYHKTSTLEVKKIIQIMENIRNI